MATKNDGGYTSNRSAFGGFMLEGADGVDGSTAQKLAEFGITDAEQVIALSVLPDVRPALEKALGKADLDVLISTLRSDVGEAAASAAEQAPLGTLPLGAVEPTPEIQAEIAAMAGPPMMLDEMPVALPLSVNHAQSMSIVKNQGSRGTCVAFAMTAMHEFYRRKQGLTRDYSEQFIYQRTKQIDGFAGCGTWAVKAAQALQNDGQCLEPTWAYNPNPPCNNNGVEPPNAMAEASSHKLTCVILNPKDVNAIKAALASGCTCEFSIPVWNSWYQSAATRNTGRITMKLPGDTQAGGHAMCFIGYQDDESAPGGGFFILRNSWGTGWGAQCPYGAGNGTIPYAYIAQDSWEAVTTNVPRRIWWDRDWREWRHWRDWRFGPRPFGEPGGEQGAEPDGDARRTIIIEDPNAIVIIR
jgi:hypothetical protein